MSKRDNVAGADGAKKKAAARAADAGSDAPENFKVHVLDVGEEKYGDCVLCQFGDVSVLIDGSHRGDDNLVIRQLKRLLRQQTLPVRVSLLIVTHPHDDHIGCLPSLVAGDKLRADWALVADPKYRWGEPEEAEDFFASVDYRARALAEALLEEDRSDLPDEELGLFIDNAGMLVTRYRTMLRQLETRGTRVVLNGTDDTADLLAEFASAGLKIVGPTRDHLRESARLLREGAADSLDFVGDVFGSDATMDVVSAYRNLMGGGPVADWHKPNKGAINLQSLVTRFEYRGERFIFAGDMQFSAPEVESKKLRDGVDAMLAAIRHEAPYSFVKISHHGSHNGIDEKVLAVFGETKLYGICGGLQGSSHPHPDVLQLLDENSGRLDWVRTDRNGLVTVAFGGTEPRIRVRRGQISDPVPKSPMDSDLADLIEEPAAEFGTETAASPGAPLADRQRTAGEVRATVPPNATRVSVIVDFAAAAPQPTSDPTARSDAGAGVEAGADLAEDGTAAVTRLAGPQRSALLQQLNRAKANGWVEFFAEAAQRFDWPTALLMAIGSRETNMRNILGDGGHGHGIMQIDDRSFPDFTNSPRWRIPRLNILKGAEVLNGKRRFLSRRGVAGEALTRASVAAYNGGEGRVWRAITRGLGVDSVTTQRNYSADVLARAAVFRELLG